MNGHAHDGVNGATKNLTLNGHAAYGTNGFNHPADLPSSKSPSLVLALATEAEKQKIWTINAPEWRGALSVDAYLRREKHLANQDFTRAGGIAHWILIDENDPQRTILSACETYRKKAVLATDGKVNAVVSHGIGSVFCPPACRGRGYAARMMREIGQTLRTHGVSPGQSAAFSILYSDIGKKFYNTFGWEPFNSSHISIPTSISDALTTQQLPEARPLFRHQLKSLCTVDEILVRTSMAQASQDKTFVALIPDIATINWHHAREDFVAQELHGKIPEVKGAIVGNEVGKRVWCYFTRMFYNADPKDSKGNTLHILRIVVEERGLFTWERASHDEDMSPYVPAVAALFRLAFAEAKEWNMAEVEAWNPTEATIRAAQVLCPEAKVVERDEASIASLMWYGERKGNGPVADEVDWLGNEKYGWC